MKTHAPTAIVYGGIKKIFSIALFISAFLAILAGIKAAAPPRWRPLHARLGPGTPSFFPLIRSGTTTAYDPTSNEIIVFAGLTNDPAPNPTPTAFNDVWYLTHANGMGGTPVWVNLIRQGAAGSPGPGPRWNHSAVYDVANNRMIIYGGCGSTIPGECQPLADNGQQVWVLSNANGQGTPLWTSFTPSGTHPTARQGHQAVYDPMTNSMILWAGQNGGPDYCFGANHEVWVLSHANGIGGTPNWTQLEPMGGPPAGQYFSTAVYDSSNNIMIVFGGIGLDVNGNCTVTNAAWALSNANGHEKGTPVWRPLTQQDADGSPPNRAEQLAVYAGSTANTMTIFGGTVTAGSNPFSEQRLNDTWVLSHANGRGGTPTWTQLSVNGDIPVKNYRWNSGAIDTSNNIMITFGSGKQTGTSFTTDLWVLTNPGATPTPTAIPNGM